MANKSDKELAIKKWEWIVENVDVLLPRAKNYRLVKWKYIEITEYIEKEAKLCVREIAHLRTGCSYCEKYSPTYGCKNCPLLLSNNITKTKRFGCWRERHPYMIWRDNPTKETAQKMLDFIKERG
jgi:hypothetical protein